MALYGTLERGCHSHQQVANQLQGEGGREGRGREGGREEKRGGREGEEGEGRGGEGGKEGERQVEK